jgi:hypothetical protein
LWQLYVTALKRQAETVYQYSMKWLFMKKKFIWHRLNAKKSAIMHVTPSNRHSDLVAFGIMWNGVNVPL